MPIHIEADKKDVAESVLLVGDPDRAVFIAENFFDNPVRYNSYRHLFGYTGEYKGQRVSVQTSGMGTPSITIVVEELNMLGCKNLIRVGTCGAINTEASLGDTVLATASHSSHDIYAREFPGASFSAAPDFGLTSKMFNHLSSERNSKIHTGAILCSDTFYEDSFELYKKFASCGTLAVEMESYALFYLAAKHKLRAATILTISDIIFEQKRAEKAIIQKSVERNTICALEALLDIN